MNSITKLFFVVVMFNSANAQMMENPLFSFEHLSWGMKFGDVCSALKGKELKPLETHGHSLTHGGSDTFDRFYLDTMYTLRVLVALQFAREDSVLRSVIVTYLEIDSVSGQPLRNDGDRIDRFRQKYSDRLGKPDEEKSIPFMGKAKTWTLKFTDVQMLDITSISTVSFTLLPKSEKE